MWRKELNDIPGLKRFHFIILYTYIHDMLYVIYNLLKYAFLKIDLRSMETPEAYVIVLGSSFSFLSTGDL